MADIDVAIHERVPDGQWQIVDVTFASANTDTQIPHTLAPPGPEYIEYTVIRQNGPGLIYENRAATRTAWGPTFLTLRSTTAGLVARLMLRVLKVPTVWNPGVSSAFTFSFPGTIAATSFSGSGASLTDIPESAITDGTILARVGSAETITQNWRFNSKIGIQQAPTLDLDITSTIDGATAIWPDRLSARIYATGTNMARLGIWESSDTETPYLMLMKSKASNAAVTSGTYLGSVYFLGKYGSNATDWGTGGDINLQAGENWSSTARGGAMVFTTVANGATASTERLRLHSNGYVGINNAAPTVNLDLVSSIDGATAAWPDRVVGRIKSTGTNLARWSLWCESDTAIPDYNLMRSKASNAAVTSDLNLGAMSFMGKFGSGATDWYTGGQIAAYTGDTNWSSTEAGTSLRFYTVAKGSTTITERMRVAQDGRVGINRTSPAGMLHVVGNSAADTVFHLEGNSDTYATYQYMRGHSTWYGHIFTNCGNTTEYCWVGNRGDTSGNYNVYIKSGTSWVHRTRTHLYGFDVLGAFHFTPKSSNVGSGTYNNLQLTYHAERVFYEITPTGNMTITGLDANAQEGKIYILVNSSTSYTITLTNEDTASTAAYRFKLPGGVSYVIGTGGGVMLIYDGSSTHKDS